MLWKTPILRFITGELAIKARQNVPLGMFSKPAIAIGDFDYPLPDEQIAYTPAPNRADSKLLVWDQDIIAENTYSNIASYIPEQSTLIFNNSKVIAARLLFEKNNEHTNNHAQKQSIIEIFCLEPTQDYTPVLLAMQATNKVSWNCLVGGAKKWKEEIIVKEININNNTIYFNAKKIQQENGKFVIEFSWNNNSITFSEILTAIGKIPLPPYIQRAANQQDIERYQTTYAMEEGSVAAPTAGLHFNKAVFESLDQKKIHQQYLTLHVGAGTFMPVKSETIDQHEMHAEFIEVDFSLIEYIYNNNQSIEQPIVAVGTTSIRTIESVYWLGVKISQSHKKNIALSPNELTLSQWEAYELAIAQLSVKESMHVLMLWMQLNQINKLIAKTQLMVTPGYTFKVCKGLITNFHQPKSTLLLIIAAITGNQWRDVYTHALKNKYRFLSYGDGCLFWIKQQEV